jgi:hypothetical protein
MLIEFLRLAQPLKKYAVLCLTNMHHAPAYINLPLSKLYYAGIKLVSIVEGYFGSNEGLPYRETEFFRHGDGKKTRSLPCRTALSMSGEETEYFRHGDEKKLGLSPAGRNYR